MEHDPELAQEMIQLLGNELKQLRQKFRETETKPTTQILEEANNALRIQVKDLQSQLDKRSIGNNEAQDDNAAARLKLEEKMKKNKTRHRENEEALQLEIKKLVGINRELEEANSQIQSDLESIRQELEATKSELSAAVGASTNDSDSFDLERFLSDPEPPANYQDPPTNEPEKLQLRKRSEFDSLVSPHGHHTRQHPEDDIMWSRAGPGHCFLPSPTHTYELHSGGLCCSQPLWEVGATGDLFCTERIQVSERTVTKYYGTYECTYAVTMDYQTLEKVSEKMARSLLQRLTPRRELTPPIITNLMEKLYTTGAFKFHCVVLQCVGYNHVAYNKITAKIPKAVPPEVPPKVAPPKVAPAPGAGASSSKKGSGQKRKAGKHPKNQPKKKARKGN